MCIAIYKTKGGKISQDRLAEASLANPDGFGVLFRDMADGSLWSLKTIEPIDDLFTDDIKANQELILHFRTASSGAIGQKYCHPIFVNKDLAFVQNGNYPELAEGNDDKTDVQRFNEQVLQKLPKDFLHIFETRLALEKYNRESFSKMIFMDARGRVDLINEQAGEWRDGCWYSNGGIENYTGYGYSGAYYYQAGEIRHKGGLQSVMMFSEERRKKYDKCQRCQGWFLMAELKNGRCRGCMTFEELLKYID